MGTKSIQTTRDPVVVQSQVDYAIGPRVTRVELYELQAAVYHLVLNAGSLSETIMFAAHWQHCGPCFHSHSRAISVSRSSTGGFMLLAWLSRVICLAGGNRMR